MSTLVIKRSIVIEDDKTSVSLEDKFWIELKRIAIIQDKTLSQLVGMIRRDARSHTNLSSAIRLYVLDWALREDLKANGDGQPTGAVKRLTEARP